MEMEKSNDFRIYIRDWRRMGDERQKWVKRSSIYIDVELGQIAKWHKGAQKMSQKSKEVPPSPPQLPTLS